MTNVPTTRPATRRAYRSSKRSQAAAATRRAVLTAAAELFSEHGYGSTTMQAIATRAKVSVETVYAQGGKRQLLLACVDIALAGDDAPTAIADRPEVIAALAHTEQRQVIVEFSSVLVAMIERAAGVLRAFEDASRLDRDLAREWRAAESRRRADLQRFVDALVGAQYAAEARRHLTDALWATITPRLGHTLLHDLGWSPEQVLHWTVTVIEATVPKRNGIPDA